MDDIWMNKASGAGEGRLQVGAADGSVPLRLVQVYLTPVIDEFLRQARSMAITQGFDVSASAVVRHAMERLMATASPAEMVALLGRPKGRSQHKRGRPRRLSTLYTLNYACIFHKNISRVALT
jgi:hypothetical protein